MERKELSHMAIELIEEALTKPGSEIFLEKRVKNPICEPTVRGQTDKQLDNERESLLGKIMDFSTRTNTYSKEVFETVDGAGVLYTNGSLIMLYEDSKKYNLKDAY